MIRRKDDEKPDVNTKLINQFAGSGTALEILREMLGDERYSWVRILVAFARGSGVGLVGEELASFIERGGRVQVIVGLDLDGTSPDALKSLISIGAEVRVFGTKGSRTFHPKAFIFGDGEDYLAALVGSFNLTAGGLDSNFETGLLITLDVLDEEDSIVAAQLEDLWATYSEPAPPMSAGHLRVVDDALIAHLADRLPQDSGRPPDGSSSSVADELFDEFHAPRASSPRPPHTREMDGETAQSDPGVLPRFLYLEAGIETAGGREIQLPLDVLAEYFGVTRNSVYFMTFHHEDGTVERNTPLAIYGNSTFRIRSGKFAEVPENDRPMMVRLERRAEPDEFSVLIRKSDDEGFDELATRLNRGGGNSKRWGTS